jgi:hypothetical protein
MPQVDVGAGGVDAELHAQRPAVTLGLRQPRGQLLIGIGGSALGPQFVANALSTGAGDRLEPFFFDNTDPHGFARVLGRIGAGLARTLTVVVSKSGATKETRNGMLAAQRAYEQRGLAFGAHAAFRFGLAHHAPALLRLPLLDQQSVGFLLFGAFRWKVRHAATF